MRLPRWVAIKCRHAHELLSARMDHAPMGLAERFRLWVHLRVCDLCARVDRQMTFMREAVRRLDR